MQYYSIVSVTLLSTITCEDLVVQALVVKNKSALIKSSSKNTSMSSVSQLVWEHLVHKRKPRSF